MNRRMRVLIVGCGRIAGEYNQPGDPAVLTHAAAYRRLDAQLIGCCDRDGERAERFARRWGIQQFGDHLPTLLRQTSPEVVSLCTPPQGRLSSLETILEADCVRAVLLEKPVAATVQEAKHILECAEAVKRPVLVNYFRAFDPFYRDLAQRCHAGEFGPLCEGAIRYYGTALANASHMLERLLAMCGSPTELSRLGGEADHPIFELRFGAARVVFLPTMGCTYAPIECDLLFKARRVRVIDSERRIECFEARPDPLFPAFFNLVPDQGRDRCTPSHESIVYAVEATLRAADGEPVEPDILRRGVEVTQILETVGASGA